MEQRTLGQGLCVALAGVRYGCDSTVLLLVYAFYCTDRYDLIRLHNIYVAFTQVEVFMSPRIEQVSANFKTMRQLDVPQGRKGKHREIVTRILSDLAQLEDGRAFKIPLKDLAQSKEKVRSALNRATRKAGRNVATASDSDFLYVWNKGQ